MSDIAERFTRKVIDGLTGNESEEELDAICSKAIDAAPDEVKHELQIRGVSVYLETEFFPSEGVYRGDGVW